jgi:hypothetical protein
MRPPGLANVATRNEQRDPGFDGWDRNIQHLPTICAVSKTT